MIEHALRQSDSLESLSVFYGIPVCMILRANAALHFAPLQSTVTLKIPDRQYCMRLYEDSKNSWVQSPFIDYKIREGDTIYEIAQRHRTTMNIIAQLNRLIDPEELTPGQSLKILKPPAGSVHYTVKYSDTMKDLSSRFKIPLKCLCAFNCIPDNYTIRPGMQLIIPQ